jgi:methionyl-tRNA formyltransferase
LAGNETKSELARRLLSLGARLLSDNLPSILDGKLEPTPQKDSQATYTRLLTKADAATNFKAPAELIERKVRAFAGFPKVHAKVFDKDIIITKARVAKGQSDGKLIMRCQPGWLEISELTGPSGRSMSGADFIRGYKKT